MHFVQFVKLARENLAMCDSLGRATSKPAPRILVEAILRTVAYADVFDYPLTAGQIHRYLVGVAVSPSDVREALNDGSLVPRRLTQSNGYYCLSGRAEIVKTRLHRATVAARMWPKARRYARLIASLPFVRMVAITGTLAVENSDSDADIDYLIVTAPQRVWLTRSLAIAFVHVGRLERVEICPNYVVSIDALDQFDRSLFSAHELAQMVPLYGLQVYEQLIHANRWARRYLPNAIGPVVHGTRARTRISHAQRLLKAGAEHTLRGRLGDFWEQRERGRKIGQLRVEAACVEASTAAFTPQRCKGHMHDHGARIQQAYARRLEQLRLPPEVIH
jgi:hypothetical protein